ncbi:hypothetical protein D3C81_2120940 [compost metagenome]
MALIIQPAHINNVRYVQHDDGLFKIGRHLLQHLLLVLGQLVASRRIRIILVFAGSAADDDDRLI